MKKFNKYIFLPIIFLLLFLLLIYANKIPLYDDEPTHFAQINLFLKGEYKLIEGISIIPSFHFFIARTARLFGFRTLNQFRLINFFFTFLNITLFYLITMKLKSSHPVLKTLQFAFLPILFPYRFLLYAENLSVLLILLALYCALTGRKFTSFIFSSLSVLTKQTNIVWYLFILFLIYLNNGSLKINFRKLPEFMKNNWYFFFGLIFFGIFVVTNRGVAVLTQKMHPDFIIKPGNLYWMLFLFFILFFPLNLKNISAIKPFLLKNKKLLIPLFLFLFVAVITFTSDHPWNQNPEHIRNRIILFFMSNSFWKVIYLLTVIFSLLSLFFTELININYYWLYPFTFLSLIPIWLIESRYSLPFFVLFNLFRKSASGKKELIQTVYFIILSLLIYWGYLNQQFYL